MSLLTAPLILLYLLLGLLSGLTGGLLGLGGGVIIVPVLLVVFLSLGFPAENLMHMAVATSLATIVFTASSAAWAHHRNNKLCWSLVASLLPGIIVGSICGAWLVNNASSTELRRLFGVFELLVAIQIGTGLIPPIMQKPPGAVLLVPASGGIGFLSTIMGIGGGSISVPFLLFCRVELKRAIAVSSVCGLPIALTGAVTIAALSYSTPGLPVGTIGYLYWPAAIIIVTGSVVGAYAGARLLHITPTRPLRLVFAVILAVIGAGMLV